MNFPAAVKSCFSKYAVFDGRASRSEYWYFQLFIHGVLLILVSIVAIVPAVSDTAKAVAIAGCTFYLFVWLASLAVTVRRLHDRNRSGWHYFWVLAPFFGGIVLLIWLCQKGVEGENRFGPDPLGTQ
jgi:uncharacterized membrane protein YhaH (DUF805 family)